MIIPNDTNKIVLVTPKRTLKSSQPKSFKNILRIWLVKKSLFIQKF